MTQKERFYKVIPTENMIAMREGAQENYSK